MLAAVTPFIPKGKVLAALLNQYRYLRTVAGDSRSLLARVILQNTWRISAFLDEPNFIKKCGETGIPVIEDSDVFIPQDANLNNLLVFDLDSIDDKINEMRPTSPGMHGVILSMIIGFYPLQAMGIVNQASHLLDPDFLSSTWNRGQSEDTPPNT